MENNDKAFLGTGWGFPPTFNKASASVGLVSAEEDICESLIILLSTYLGERVMQPTYGCNLQDFVFEPLSPTIASSIKEQLRTSILYHEPRILLNSLDLSLDEQLEGRVKLTIDYTIPNINSRFNLVYPFYIEESSGNLLPAVTKGEIPVNLQLGSIANV
ncbi:GPW/gp25 family protein [Calothrix sp. 336/3]|uniref:GPW/gp25 family protein n=1 Tax=Calothrix sp. 336/3 TaxID=1337936 RepID=UPI0004E39955|nr:GPW/gp25 family protein [Calothrix sp. 336/3]AKG21579.1 hypothetical protein IJ00_10100 [Calothrix sp. 336/3]